MKIKLHLFFVIVFLMNRGNFVDAQTNVPAGNVYGTWALAGSPYNVNGHISVPQDSSLTIEPGVNIVFQGHYKFNVQGRVLAAGTVNDTIVFTAGDTSTGWWGLRFDSTSYTQDSSLFEYCKLQYGKATGTGKDMNGGALMVSYFSKIRIENSCISGNSAFGNGGGIYIYSTLYNYTGGIISNCLISNNNSVRGGGIYYSGFKASQISDCIVTGNMAADTVGCQGKVYGGGIYLLNQGIVSNCVISNNTAKITLISSGCYGSSYSRGGGIYLVGKMNNCTVTNNTIVGYKISGSYLYCQGGGVAGSANISNCTVSGNQILSNGDVNNGGGIYVEATATPDTLTCRRIINCQVINNTGDGIFISEGDGNTFLIGAYISTCTVSNNTGRGISYSALHTGPIISDCTISNNAGGGIRTAWGGTIKKCTINNNGSPNTQGGGIYYWGGYYGIYDCIISNNTAIEGGGIYLKGLNGKISNCTIVNNSASGTNGKGGGIYVYAGSTASEIVNTTISNNTAVDGGGAYFRSNTKPSYLNCIIHYNTSTSGNGANIFLADSTCTPSFRYNNIQDGSTGIFVTNGSYSGIYANNIDTNPLFVSPSNGEGIGFDGLNADWSLQNSSFCIDAGDPNDTIGYYPATDLAENPRTVTCRIDMGAYEYQNGLPFLVNISQQNVLCNGDSNGTASITVNNGTAPYSYIWNTGETTTTITGLSCGIYAVTVNDAGGCTRIGIVTITQPSINISFFAIASNCSAASGSATAYASGGTTPYSYIWNDGQTTKTATGLNIGNHSVTITDAIGCLKTGTVTINQLPVNGVISTQSSNCSNSGTATVTPSGGISPYTYLWGDGQTTNPATGLAAGNHSVTITDSSGCTKGSTFNISFVGQDISIHAPILRPCTTNVIYVKACNFNTGTGTLNNAYVDVNLDTLLLIQSASLSYTSIGNNNYRFYIGNLSPGMCNSFTISCFLSCFAQTGQTLCTEALLFPKDSCAPDTVPNQFPDGISPCNTPWDKSSLSVVGNCVNDSIHFIVYNLGDSIEGDMTCYAPLRAYIDGELIIFDSLLLGGGDSAVFWYSGDGRTWRMEVDQHPLHPGNSHPNAMVERCGDSVNWTSGLENLLPMDDAEPLRDIYCGVVTNSYDPNDKTGFPLGVTDSNFISSNQQIQYLINFQNTGNDTAFAVVISDSLDSNLDIFSVIPGVASHNYSFTIDSPRVLKWTFNNILLPDSNVNVGASHGFVTFKVNQNPDLATGTVIRNSADIYFDFNAPVKTNQTTHIINSQVQTPQPKVESLINYTACGSYSLNGFLYSSTGTYFQKLQSSGGIDSVLTLNLTINNPATSSQQLSICNGDSTFLQGDFQTFAGDYFDTLQSINGCDSIIFTTLSINPTFNSVANATICSGQTFTFGTQILNSAGNFTETFYSVNGCDSIVTLALSVNQSYNVPISASICQGETYTLPDNSVVSAAGNYSITLQTMNGCDSVIETALTVYPTYNVPASASICQGETYTLPDNTVISAEGNYSSTLQTVNGCDSVIETALTVYPTYNVPVSASICQGETYTLPDNSVVSAAGNYSITLQTMNGCDSIIETTLSINQPAISNQQLAICFGDSILLQGNYQTTAGIYYDTLTSVIGCDSVIVTTLTVNSNNNTPVSAAICVGDIYVFGAQNLTAAGTYSETFNSASDCDSIVTLTLSVNPSYTETASATICNGDNYVFGMQTLTTAGTYTETFNSVSGCDSTVTLTLSVVTAFNETATASTCNGSNYVFGTQNLTASGTYSETFSSVSGCDSIVTLTLSVNPSYTETTSATICNGDTIVFGTQTLTTVGTYMEIFNTMNGCDSIVTLTLTVYSLPPVPSITQIGDTLFSSSVSGNQWYSNGNTIIPGATSQFYLPSSNGDYSVLVINANGCSSSSALFNFTGIGIREHTELIGEINIYPNPTDGSFTVEMSLPGETKAEIRIYTLSESLVYQRVIKELQSKHSSAIDIKGFSAGEYVLQIETSKGLATKKIVLK